ncbi:MAG: hypothetical protein WCQ16_11130 [Verrucomicrobiae bacterium]
MSNETRQHGARAPSITMKNRRSGKMPLLRDWSFQIGEFAAAA